MFLNLGELDMVRLQYILFTVMEALDSKRFHSFILFKKQRAFAEAV